VTPTGGAKQQDDQFQSFFVFRFPVLAVFEITPWSSPATTDVVVAADSCGNCFYFISFGIFYSNFTFKYIYIAVPSIHRLSFVLLSIWRNVNAFRCFFFSLAIINCQRQTWVACCYGGSWVCVCVFISRPCIHIRQFPVFFFSFSYQNKIKRNFVAACFSSFLFSLKKKAGQLFDRRIIKRKSQKEIRRRKMQSEIIRRHSRRHQSATREPQMFHFQQANGDGNLFRKKSNFIQLVIHPGMSHAVV
jgi:hypothetical protein